MTASAGTDLVASSCVTAFNEYANCCLISANLTAPEGTNQDQGAALLGAIAVLPKVSRLQVDGSGFAWSAVQNTLSALGSRLEDLAVYRVQVTALAADAFSAVPRLRRLILSQCDIGLLPPGVFTPLSRLEFLNFGRNRVGSLPEGIFQPLSSLKDLRFGPNRLNHLPPNVFRGMSQLRLLFFGDNRITALESGVFDDLTRLDALMMRSNAITALPPGCFDRLPLTNILGFGGNPIASFPEGIFGENLGELRSLIFSDANITSLSDGVFSRLTSLQLLVFSYNRLTALPPGVFQYSTRLQFLDIGHNLLTSLPPSTFAGLERLSVLLLSHNKLSLTSQTEIEGLEHLTVLDVSANELQGDLSTVLAGAPKLSTVNVSHNRQLVLNGRPWRHLPELAVLDISSTSVMPEAELCCEDCVLGLGDLSSNVSADLLREVMSTCLRTVRVLDVSANGVLDNVTRMRHFLNDFSVTLPTSIGDVEGNDNIPVLEMQQGAVICFYATGSVQRILPRNISGGNGTLFAMELPALVYTCDCSPGYHEGRDGLCYLYWGPSRIAALAVGTTLAVATALLYLLIPWYRRRHKRLNQSLELQQLLLERADSELVQLKQTWQLQWSDVTLGQRLAHGTFGEVYSATWMGNSVACKQLKAGLVEYESEAFAAEAAVMSGLRHPNIVSFFGAGVDGEGRGFLITELMTRGTLRAVLHEDKLKLPWDARLRFATDVAAGMLFLHSRQPPMLHRDLKSDNVLLDDRWVAKVADFGTLRSIHSRDGPLTAISGESSMSTASSASLLLTATNYAGTPLWSAPESAAVGREIPRYGIPADVYSFGIVLFEIATRLMPYDHLPEISLWQLRDRIQDGERPMIPEGAQMPAGYEDLMRSCWAAAPEDRPPFASVAVKLRAVSSTLQLGDGTAEFPA